MALTEIVEVPLAGPTDGDAGDDLAGGHGRRVCGDGIVLPFRHALHLTNLHGERSFALLGKQTLHVVEVDVGVTA